LERGGAVNDTEDGVFLGGSYGTVWEEGREEREGAWEDPGDEDVEDLAEGWGTWVLLVRR
jgi:hypothetical protein